MRKFFNYLIPILFIVYYGFYFYVKNTGADKGESAPDFEAVLIDGTPFKLSDLRGRYVLLDFWASWCLPCRRANPNLAKLQQKYGDKLSIVTIALEKRGEAWKRAAEMDGFTWKYQIVEHQKLVMLSDIARKYGVSEIPAKFLISPEGKLLEKMSFDEIDQFLSTK